MKTKTERILMVLKVLAFLGGIGYSIECGAELVSFIASFINPAWAQRAAFVNQGIFSLRDYNSWFYICTMCLIIIVSAMKAFIWYVVADLLVKLKINTPFSIGVAKKLEKIAYLLFGVWAISAIGQVYVTCISKTIGLQLAATIPGDEYLFIAGIVYIISQIFKRGIEMQEENQLTV